MLCVFLIDPIFHDVQAAPVRDVRDGGERCGGRTFSSNARFDDCGWD